jgi:FkbM family methyltransferase
VPYPVLFWKFWRFMPKEDRLELPERILASAREMELGYQLLSDERSRLEFRAQIRWRCLLDFSCLPPHNDPREMYFPPDLFRLSPEEVFVDCGAFDGDSLRAFLSVANGQFNRIYAWEADAANAVRLRQCVLDLPSGISARIIVMPHAVGRQDGVIGFSADGTEGSKIGTSAGNAGTSGDVVCRSIDSACASVGPSLIKMDIEGAEPEALLGATRTMARDRPVMAICAYHRCEHLWSIPQLLKAANPDYEIFLRRYAEDCWETVYYAVPPERLVFPGIRSLDNQIGDGLAQCPRLSLELANARDEMGIGE